MKEIANIEEGFRSFQTKALPDFPYHLAHSSVDPLQPRSRPAVQLGKPTAAYNMVFGRMSSLNYLPAQYFDYIAGTSTGG